MNDLVRYDTARRALAEAHRVDEVKDIRDRALAMQQYARQAKDSELIEWATEIRLRAERRAGQLLIEMRGNGERQAQGGTGSNQYEQKSPADTSARKLSDLGVTKTQSSRWQHLARLDDEAFEARTAGAARAAVHSVEATAAERTAEKKAAREAREAELGALQVALPARRYGVIYADPEWRFEVWSRETGLDRSADNHYPTSDLAEIMTRDVQSIAAEDCVLFLWATGAMLPQALAVMSAWGFAYKTHIVWAKDRTGTGYWVRNRHELLLIGARGDIPAPAMGTQSPSLIEAPVGEHSEKPEAFQAIIESYFPSLPKIELNARRARPGWDVWGNEAPENFGGQTLSAFFGPPARHISAEPSHASSQDIQ
jgi:N6-adenosine-specific RNA methylase IME4